MTSKRKILLAEDQPANARLIGAYLESSGYDVEYATDGEQAATLAQRIAYDVILMDVNMPKMSGLEATRAIRNGAAPMRGVAIIALTADDDGSVQKDCIAAGMNSFLAKPVQKTALLAMIERTLGGDTRRRRRPAL